MALSSRRCAQLASFVLALTCVPAHATVNQSMQDWFNEIGAYGNVTGPNAYRGQTMNMYTGGSLYMRTPVRNYQLASISPPSFSAGCGGIDLFAGSFSFINKEQFVSLLRNIGNNAIGAAFNMALCSMSPDLCDLLKYLQDQATKMNNLNINSCQAAEGIVSAVGSMVTDRVQEKEGKTAGASLNMFGDVFESWDEWKKSRTTAKNIRNAAKATSQGAREIFDPGNVVWRSLNRISGITDETRELLMSLTGTIIVTPPGENADEKARWTYLPGGKLTFRQFVGDGASATVNLPGLKCGTDLAECMTPSFSETAFTVAPFSRQVRTRIATMRDKIVNRDTGGQSSMDAALIGSSSLPVWKMLAVSSSIPGGDRITEDYAQLIAVDVAYAYFTNLSKTLRNALQNDAGKSGPDAVMAAEKILVRLTEVEQEARDMLRAEYQKGMQVAELSRSLQLMHQSLNSGMPTNIFQSMAVFNR
ncbi:conjugal transfer protein TraH [Ampullimonas aquatilis]|uniref:conjugal transfer protein TraH n=1 Tax=Ampullimonas aquatilis TaxID=1341549 RepID=UPI003BD213C9